MSEHLLPFQEELQMKYYTYAHYTADTKELFYIGKGTTSKDFPFKRAFSEGGRNYLWKHKVKKHSGFLCEILASWKTEKEAFEHEIFLISVFAGKLVNLTLGGEGCSGRKQSEEEKTKRANSIRGLKRTPLTLKRMSEAQKKNKVAKDTLINNIKLQKKQVLCIDTEIIYNSISDAGREMNIAFQNISKVCKKQRPKAGGYKWEFVNDRT